MTAVVAGPGPFGQLVVALVEQLCDVGLADSDPSGAAGAPGEAGLRTFANPALRALTVAVAGPAGAGTAVEVALGAVLVVLPFAVAALTVGEPAAAPARGTRSHAFGTHPAATGGDAL